MTEHNDPCPNCGDDHAAVEALKAEYNFFHGLTGLAANEQGLALAAVAVFTDPTLALREDAAPGDTYVVGAAGYADPFHIDAARLARILREEADRIEANTDEFNKVQADARTELEARDNQGRDQ